MNEKLPLFIHVGGIIGLCMLVISIIIFIIYMTLFNEARDTNVTVTRLNISTTESAMMVSYIVIGSIGFLLCLLIPYGHHLKSLNDPSIISSKNGLHFEKYNDGKQTMEAVDVIKPSKYKLAGSEGSNILPNRTSSFQGFSNDSAEKFL